MWQKAAVLPYLDQHRHHWLVATHHAYMQRRLRGARVDEVHVGPADGAHHVLHHGCVAAARCGVQWRRGVLTASWRDEVDVCEPAILRRLCRPIPSALLLLRFLLLILLQVALPSTHA
jgi:hypothetical protein